MDDEKFVDESWKDAVANEKEKQVGEPLSSNEEVPASPENQEGEMPEINFIGYITSLAFQAMVFLGEVPNPMTDKIEKNLRQAKFIIDTLVLLRDKTNGNLTPQEADALNAYLYELQVKFVENAQKEGTV